MSSLAKRLYRSEDRYVKAPFSVKRDRKTHGLIADFGDIPVSDRSLYRDQYVNALWFLEKENSISLEDFDPSLKTFMVKHGFSREESKAVISAPTWRVPISIRSVVFLLECGVSRAGAEAYAIEYLRSAIEIGATEQSAYCPLPVGHQRSRVIPFRRKNDGSDLLITDLEELEDRLLTMTQKDRDGSAVDLIVKRNPTPEGLKKVKALFAPRLAEVTAAINGTDPEIVEAYRHMNRKQLRVMEEWFTSIVSFSPAKPAKPIVPKKSRAKMVMPSKVVAKLRYMTRSEELGIESIKPERVVGAAVLWVYDAKYNNLLCYEAKDSTGLFVRSSKILNWDEAKSLRKTPRNPEKFLPELLGKNRIGMRKLVENLKTRSYGCSGHLNENILLLRTY